MRYHFLRFPEGKFKAVTLSYDDGCRFDIRFSETINKYGLKCTFNINSAWYGNNESDWHLTKEEIKKYLLDTGHELAVHGAEHKANGNVRCVEGIRDVLNCRLALEKDFDQIIRGMAYPDTGITQFPNGTTMADIESYLKQLDIVYSRTLGRECGNFELPQNWYQWMPTAHHNTPAIMEYIDKFVNLKKTDTYLARRTPKLFYMWGHSYEFDSNNNWEHLDEICEKLGNKDDIWYATNYEIYEYVKAYQSLIYSADGSKIYNPTLKTIWLEIDDVLYSIKSGETLKI